MPSLNPNLPQTADWADYLGSLKQAAGAIQTPLGSQRVQAPAFQHWGAGQQLTDPITGKADVGTPAATGASDLGGLSTNFEQEWQNLLKSINGQVSQPDFSGDPVAAATQAGQAQSAYTSQVAPGLPNLMADYAGAAGAQLAGRVSPGTTNAITRMAQERGVAIGMPNAPATQTAMLGAIGRTAEQQVQSGQAAAMNLAQLTKVDPATFVVTPAQRAQITADLQKNYLNVASQLYATNVDAATKVKLQNMKDQQELLIQQHELQNTLQVHAFDENAKQALTMLQHQNSLELQQKDIEAKLQSQQLDIQSRKELQTQSEQNQVLLQQMRDYTAAYEATLNRDQQAQVNAARNLAELQSRQMDIAGQLQARAMDSATRIQLAREQYDNLYRIAELKAYQQSFAVGARAGGYFPYNVNADNVFWEGINAGTGPYTGGDMVDPTMVGMGGDPYGQGGYFEYTG